MFGLRCLIWAVAARWVLGDWSAVNDMIQQFKFLPNVSFSAGDASGRKHTFEKGGIRMDTPLFLASSSKFPAAVAIAGVVAEGHLTFDTKANEVFEWWTQDSGDDRSTVTLRSLLNFASGLVCEDVGGCGMNCLGAVNATMYSPETCAQEIYTTGPWVASPGTFWSYHSMHLQVAGAMAAKAANLSMQALLDRFLLKRINMTSSRWLGYPNPHLAATLISTGDDYDKFLQSVFNYDIASKEIIDEMEVDAYQHYPGLRPSSFEKDINLQYYGHYSMCTYFECVGQNWSAQCLRNGIHADPGLYGYWPLIDRSKGYYMQLATQRVVTLPAWALKMYNISESEVDSLSAECVAPLRFGIQASVEAALNKSFAEADSERVRDDPFAALCALAEGSITI